MAMNFDDPSTQLILATVGGALLGTLAGGLIAGALARRAANSRIRKLAAAQAELRKQLAAKEPHGGPAGAGSGGAGGASQGPGQPPRPAPSQHTQFGEHQDAWDRLSDLRLSIDRLWARPTQRNADEFSRHLQAVHTWVYDREVKLDEPHSSDLRRLVDQLEAFRDNKNGLHDLMRQRPPDEAALTALTDRYAEVRKQYDALVESLPAVFKQKAGA